LKFIFDQRLTTIP
jgi:hypothetical protein